MDQLTSQLYKEDTYLQRLPVIKGQVKNVKMLLQEDLIADGAIVRNVPFSSRNRQLALFTSHNSVSKRSLAPSA